MGSAGCERACAGAGCEHVRRGRGKSRRGGGSRGGGAHFAARSFSGRSFSPRSALVRASRSWPVELRQGGPFGIGTGTRPGFVGVPLAYGAYAYGYGSGCSWLRYRALETGSRYWWSRYYDCINGYY